MHKNMTSFMLYINLTDIYFIYFRKLCTVTLHRSTITGTPGKCDCKPT